MGNGGKCITGGVKRHNLCVWPIALCNAGGVMVMHNLRVWPISLCYAGGVMVMHTLCVWPIALCYAGGIMVMHNLCVWPIALYLQEGVYAMPRPCFMCVAYSTIFGCLCDCTSMVHYTYSGGLSLAATAFQPLPQCNWRY